MKDLLPPPFREMLGNWLKNKVPSIFVGNPQAGTAGSEARACKEDERGTKSSCRPLGSGEIRARPGGKRASHEIESQPIECVALSQGDWPLSRIPLSVAIPCAGRRPVDLCQSKHLPVSNRAAPPATPGRRIFYKASSSSSIEQRRIIR